MNKCTNVEKEFKSQFCAPAAQHVHAPCCNAACVHPYTCALFHKSLCQTRYGHKYEKNCTDYKIQKICREIEKKVYVFPEGELL